MVTKWCIVASSAKKSRRGRELLIFDRIPTNSCKFPKEIIGAQSFNVSPKISPKLGLTPSFAFLDKQNFLTWWMFSDNFWTFQNLRVLGPPPASPGTMPLVTYSIHVCSSATTKRWGGSWESWHQHVFFRVLSLSLRVNGTCLFVFKTCTFCWLG